jgi:3-keto-L-gulonate-6-phosphate decarboxylase
MKTNEIMKRTIVFLFAQLSKTDKKQVIDALNSGAKLTKADAGRLLSSMPIKELAGIGLISGMAKAELIDAIKESAKLTKADAG